jgi:DASS family divalent anion:Na+ symporter
VVTCAIFLTGQASNVLIASMASQTAGVELGYGAWLLGATVPGAVGLAVTGLLVYRLVPPEVKHTPGAARIARDELARLGPMARGEKLMFAVFGLVAILWMTTALHHLNHAAVALLGISVLLVSGVLTWEDVKSERGAWDVFIWYGGLVQLAALLGETGITRRFAESAGGLTTGWPWWAALLVLLLVYYYAHYGFASITAHSTAMYAPFLTVMLVAGAPAGLAALTLAYGSNLMASLTHYGTTPGPIYFGAGYVSQARWWRVGLVVSVASLVVWLALGPPWWKLLGAW